MWELQPSEWIAIGTIIATSAAWMSAVYWQLCAAVSELKELKATFVSHTAKNDEEHIEIFERLENHSTRIENLERRGK